MKQVIKSTIRSLCLILILPAVAVYRLQAAFSCSDKAITSWSQLFSLLPGLVGVYLRHAFYRCTLGACETDVSIGFGTIFSHSDATIGKTTYIGNYCSIGDVDIANDVLIASHVSIMNGCRQHSLKRLDIPVREQPGVFSEVSIGEDTWIGEKATIAASVGKHCVIGAGTLVTTPIPDYAVAVGVPARVIRDRRDSSSKFSAVPGMDQQALHTCLSDSHLISTVGDTRR